MEEKPDIEVIDTSNNYFDQERGTILLDKRLKQYPKAFEYIKNHELTHHRNYIQSDSWLEVMWRDALHEFKTDLDIAFNDSEALKQLRNYRKQVLNADRNFSRFLVQSIRNFWAFPLYLLSGRK